MGRTESTCWSVVFGAAAGDQDHREAFARRYDPVLRAYLAARWRLSIDHHDVHDGVQETLLECLKVGGALERVDASRPGGFRAFLYGIARNVASMAEARRRVRERRQVPEEVAAAEAGDDSFSQVFDRAWALLVTSEAREILARRAPAGSTAELRLRILQLRYEEELPSRDIASRMGIDAARVYKLLHEARREYRASLLEVMAFYHPEADREALEGHCVELLTLLGS